MMHTTEPYAGLPGHNDSDTSREAAESMSHNARVLRKAVLTALEAQPMTVHECARVMNVAVPSVQPRFSELKAAGKIIDSGERKPNNTGHKAIVWKIAPAGTLPPPFKMKPVGNPELWGNVMQNIYAVAFGTMPAALERQDLAESLGRWADDMIERVASGDRGQD